MERQARERNRIDEVTFARRYAEGVDREVELRHMREKTHTQYREVVSTYEYDPDNPNNNSAETNERVAHINYQMGKYGDRLEDMQIGERRVLAEKGIGAGTRTTGANSRDVYDDRITYIERKSDGKIVIKEYHESNMEPTTKDGVEYKTLSSGKYSFFTKRRYYIVTSASKINKLESNPNTEGYAKVDGQWVEWRNINYSDGKEYPYIALEIRQMDGSYPLSTKGEPIYGELVHQGGPENNYSKACLTILDMKNDNNEFIGSGYRSFMENFGTYDFENNEFDFSGAWGANTIRGTIYVIR